MFLTALVTGFAVLALLLAMVLFRLAALARDAGDGAEIRAQLETIRAQNERLERELRAELASARVESTQNANGARSELAGNLAQFTQTRCSAREHREPPERRLATLAQSNERAWKRCARHEGRLDLRTDNARLEQMRTTVAQLHATLETVGESFRSSGSPRAGP